MYWLNRNWPMAVVVLAAIGLGDATYLTWQHYAGGVPPCTIHGCETVLTSRYATLGPIPVALLGVAYYLAVLVLGVINWRHQSGRWLVWLRLIVSFGFVMTLGLVYLQGFVIKAWCQYCLVSAAVTTLMFALVLTVRRPPPQTTINSLV